MQQATRPRVSVVTVVLDDPEGLLSTIESVLSQSYQNIQFVVVDGGSKADTVDLIEVYKNDIDIIVSEADRGIYDAMNKGLMRADGEWISFMNSGDVFFSRDTIFETFGSVIPMNIKILFGDVVVEYPSGDNLLIAANVNELNRGMGFCHQSAFIRTEFHQLRPFDLEYKYAADFAFFYKANREKNRFLYLNETVSKVRYGGLSNINRGEVFWEYFKIMKCEAWHIRFYFLFKIIDSQIRTLAKIILPKSFIIHIFRRRLKRQRKI